MKHFRLISKIFTPALAVVVISGALALAPPSLTYAVDSTSATPPATNSTGATPTNPDDQINCNVLPQEICNQAKAKPSSDGAKGTAIYDLLIWALKILTALVGVAAVGALVYAGILYSSASNDSSQVSKAKTIIRDTVIGIVVYGFMFLILNWLIPGGVLG